MNEVVILVVAVTAVCLAFAVVVISYIYRRRRTHRSLQKKSPPFKPSCDVVTKPRTSSLVDLLGTAMGPDMSPVTPTEFFSTGKVLHQFGKIVVE